MYIGTNSASNPGSANPGSVIRTPGGYVNSLAKEISSLEVNIYINKSPCT
jgi:hypothetical protein